ncbi:helicase, partial [Trifolium medium]|nr:helicase [Trifolium medium]
MAEVQRKKQERIAKALAVCVKEDISVQDIFNTLVGRVFGKASLGQKALRHFAGWLKIMHGQDILQIKDVAKHVE